MKDGHTITILFEQFYRIAPAVHENTYTAIGTSVQRFSFTRTQSPSKPLRKSIGPWCQKCFLEASRCSSLINGDTLTTTIRNTTTTHCDPERSEGPELSLLKKIFK
jgi:hypothetical protein